MLKILELIAFLLITLFSCFPQEERRELREESAAAAAAQGQRPLGPSGEPLFRISVSSLEFLTRVSLGSEKEPQQVEIRIPPPKTLLAGVSDARVQIFPADAQEGAAAFTGGRWEKDRETLIKSSDPRFLKMIKQSGTAPILVVFWAYKPETIEGGLQDKTGEFFSSIFSGGESGPKYLVKNVSGAGAAQLTVAGKVVSKVRVAGQFIEVANALALNFPSGPSRVAMSCRQSLTGDGSVQQESLELATDIEVSPPFAPAIVIRPAKITGDSFHVACVVVDSAGGSETIYFWFRKVGNKIVYLPDEKRIPAYPVMVSQPQLQKLETRVLEGWGK